MNLMAPNSTATRATLGYVGLGIMGGAMAGNLLSAGHDLLVYNRTASKAEPLVRRGATMTDSPAAMAEQGPSVIFLNVTDTPDVEHVMFGEHGIAVGARPGLIVVDHSTINSVATQRFASRLLDEYGVVLIDAPVSGGDVGAQNGTLSIMVGGPEDAVASVRPYLDVVGGRVVHLGPVGMGQACKACNQVAVIGALLGTVEAMGLACKSGLDLSKMIEVVGGGAAGSWQLSNLGPQIAKGDDAPGFMVDYLLKDLKIVLDTADELGLPLEMTAMARQWFDHTSRDGLGKAGTQSVAHLLEKRGGFSFAAGR